MLMIGHFARHRILLGPKSARELYPLESERKSKVEDGKCTKELDPVGINTVH